MATGNISTKQIYSDIFIDLDKHPVNKDVAKSINEESVKASIKHLILTDRGERLMQPNLGGNIRSLLFNNFTPQTMLNAQQLIEETIKNHELRANLIGVVVSPTEDDNALAITIVFNVINIQQPITLELVLRKIR